ncbi:hypothetical protein COT82_01970 [Candidatus Campbellbacteria bacterium CG10_big_fil_rev_8_21_14_0_10_35_52]|uniref:POTRA domain-containing protein n=1 Tax=Candidatus Campbellbacteria bacterium CG10_big_fil_rev_8_21_14_0_10_35_52 TaxID=1974527 RepID=A0A2M6WVD4_9BACT|nr:MAG: hypothetical protein COT82_01970 [Candidatus Campbellbacteria bacterium CG10_big_fil_rev_8_21_14_0_10_35_52]
MTLARRRFYRKSSKLAKRKRKLFLLKISGIVLAIIAIIAGAVFILRIENIKIANILIDGNFAVSDKSIRMFAQERISGNYLFFFPKSSILLYPRRNMEAAIFDAFKSIKDINIEAENLQTISIKIKERKPSALWCGVEIHGIIAEELNKEQTEEQIERQQTEEKDEEKKLADKCYFLDEGGFIFSEAPEFSGNAYFRYYGPLLGEENEAPIGRQFMTEEDFDKIIFFLSSLKEIGLKSVYFGSINEDDFEIKFESGGRIFFGKKQNLSYIFDNIKSVFESKEFNEKDMSELDYADFRFGNRVYFKFY